MKPRLLRAAGTTAPQGRGVVEAYPVKQDRAGGRPNPAFLRYMGALSMYERPVLQRCVPRAGKRGWAPGG
jgi:hypothetical protein